MFQKNPLCQNRDIQTQAILPSVVNLSALHWDTLTTSYELLSNMLKFGFRNQKVFNHIYMRALSRISFPAAGHTRKIRACVFAGEVDKWSSAWGI